MNQTMGYNVQVASTHTLMAQRLEEQRKTHQEQTEGYAQAISMLEQEITTRDKEYGEMTDDSRALEERMGSALQENEALAEEREAMIDEIARLTSELDALTQHCTAKEQN
jgi:chromosome segregation ATPase